MSGGSLERWDIVLRFMNGPLRAQGELTWRGPVVRIGANPGPGELRLENYRGLDDRQAVITAYDSGSASIAPVGMNQVRLAPHEHVNWNEVHALSGPAHLTPGCAVHLGPPGRGASFVFVDCRRLGVWQEQHIKSEAQTTPEASQIAEIDPNAGVPKWFLPALVSIGGFFGTTLLVSVIYIFADDWQPLGVPFEGQERQTVETPPEYVLDHRIVRYFDTPYLEFVVGPNATAAADDTLRDRKNWDARLVPEVERWERYLAQQKRVWASFERAHNEYRTVLTALREAELPDAFAAIPFQESGYHKDAMSNVCALGWWQFMPEVAHRAGIEVAGCTLSNNPGVQWSPTGLAVPMPTWKAPYIYHNPPNMDACMLRSCVVDERKDLEKSTAGAVKLLGEAWRTAEVQKSGAGVQMVIGSHNAGFDDSPWRNGVVSTTQVLPAWRTYSKAKGKELTPSFWGDNMTCLDPAKAAGDAGGTEPGSRRCGGPFWQQTQNYVPLILAYQFVAACYYGKNYASEEAFREYAAFFGNGGYCTQFRVPTNDEVTAYRFGSK